MLCFQKWLTDCKLFVCAKEKTSYKKRYLWTFQILGDCQGRRTGVGVTTVSNSLILGGWVTKVLKNGDKKIEGGRVGDNNILTFLCHWLDKKMPL